MINILVPIAGAAKAFKEKGYVFPKPLLEVSGKPMIQVICENLTIEEKHRFIFVVRKSDYEDFALGNVLKIIAPGCEVVILDGETPGAACSALLAINYIKGDTPLLIANGDQYLEIDLTAIIRQFLSEEVHGGVITFESVHPKWSFVKVNEDGFVTEAVEKRPISKYATAGLYFFRKGDYYIEAAKSMIKKDARVMGEFFICPVYNEMILKGMKIKAVNINLKNMHSLGMPDDVIEFRKKNILKEKS